MSRGRGVAALVLLLVGISGVLAGIALDRTVLRPQPAERAAVPGMSRRELPRRQDEFRARFADELDLTAEQRRIVDSLMDRQLAELRALRLGSQPRVESVIRQTRRAIDSVLTPEQRDRLAELSRERRQRRMRR